MAVSPDIDQKSASRPCRSRRAAFGWFCAHALGVCFVALTMALVVVGALMVRLANGPLSINGVTERIAGELGARLGADYRVELGASSIERVGSGLRLAMAGLSVRRQDGKAIFVAPRAEVSIAMAPLLIGSIKPTRVQIFDVELGLTILENGELAISAGAEPISLGPRPAAPPAVADAAPVEAAAPAAPPSNALAPLAKAVSDILGALSDDASPLARMEQVGIVNGRLSFDDRRNGRSIVFDKVEMGFARQNGKADMIIAADGPAGRWQASAKAIDATGNDRALELEIHDITFDEIALAAGMKSSDVFFDTPLSAVVRIGIDDSGALRGANARFNAGAGYLYMRDEDFEPIYVEQITGGFRWDAATKRVEIEPTQWAAGDTRLMFTGMISPPATPDGDWRVEGRTEPGSVLGAEQPGDVSLPMDDASLAISIAPATHRLRLEHFEAHGPDIDVRLTGDFDWGETSRELRLNLAAGRMPVRAALRVWPSFIAPPVHTWMLSHVDAGYIEQGALTLDFDGRTLDNAFQKKLPPDDERISADFSISGATLRFLPGVPPLVGLDVVGHTTGHTAAVTARRGAIEGAPGHRMTLSEGAFNVADTTLKPAPATISMRLAGAVESLVDILSRDGFKPFVGNIGDTSTVHGQVDGKVFVDLLLDKKPRPDDTQVRANAMLADLAIDRLIGKERFDQGQVSLTVDKSGMRASGPGRLFGGAAQIDFKKPPVGPLEANISFALDDAARARVAPAFASGMSGPIQARVTSTVVGKEAPPAHVELDFAKTAIDNVLPGLVKPAGRPGKATFRATPGADGTRIDQIVFEASTGAAIRGALDLDNAGALRSARFTQMRLSPGDDAKVDVDQGKDALKIVVRGAAIDARPFLRGLFGSDGSRDDKSRDSLGGNIDLDLKTTLATGANRQALSGVDLKMARRGGVVRSFQLQGRLGGASVVASTAPDRDGVATISLNSSDGGALLSFVDLYRRMEGGRLRAGLQLSDKGVDGSIFISDFILRDEPALRRLVSEGAPPGADAPARKIDTTAAPFQRLSATFTRNNGALRVRDGLLYGAQIGIKIDGTLDVVRDRVDMSGTFVPAYGLNNLFTQIPLVGPILLGGNHEGLFAVNFRISGPASAPSLVINPLSAIAPGFLRKIFGAGAGAPQEGVPDDASSSIPR